MEKVGLLLTGGGARVAYQAGVLKAIAEVCGVVNNPFNIVSGVSGGAINGIWISSQESNFKDTTQLLWDGWTSITHDQIYNTDPLSFLKITSHWVRDLSFKRKFENAHFRNLLDSSPLKKFIETKINFSTLQKNISVGKVHGISVTTTNYNSGSSVIFYDGDHSITPWNSEWRETRRVHLDAKHVLASTSIPVFFPPVKLEDGFYGDGGIKLISPLSPLIHMGANKILAISLHHKGKVNSSKKAVLKDISMGDVVGTLLNAMFFHSIEMDIERCNRINRTVSILTKDQLLKEPDNLRHVPLLMIQPSLDLRDLEIDFINRFPKILKYLLRGIGASEVESKDLMSYLAFEGSYIQALLDLGYKDGLDQRAEIQAFFKVG